MDKSKKNASQDDNDNDSGFDYDDLISDFTSGPVKDDDGGQRLDTINLDDLLGDEKDASELAEEAARREDDEMTEIFDNLDDLARDSIFEDGGEKTTGDDESVSDDDESDLIVEDHYDFGEISLEEDIEDAGGDYASILSQIENGARKNDTEDTVSDTDSDEGDSGLEIDLAYLTGDDNDSIGDDKSLQSNEAGELAGSEVANDADSDDVAEDISLDFGGGPDALEEDESHAERSGVGMLDTDAAEGVITGEFTMDEIDLDLSVAPEPDSGGGTSGRGKEITGEFPAVADDDAREAVEIDDMLSEEKSVESAGEETVNGEYAHILADFGGEPDETAGDDASLDEDAASLVMDGADIGIGEDDHDRSGTYSDALAGFTDEPESAADSDDAVTGDEDEETDGGLDFESDFSGDDLFSGDEDEELTAAAPPAPVQSEAKADDDDFLGLGGMSSEGGGDEGRFGGTTEVLSEGVEMDFDDQIGKVTLAEVLLSQGKHDDALKLYLEIEKKKGVTPWVTERLAMLQGHGDGFTRE